MKIAVVGTGYVGLVVGACLAETGNEVVCADVSEEKIRQLQQGHIPIYEPGLEPLVTRNEAEGRLRFTTDVGGAVEASDVGENHDPRRAGSVGRRGEGSEAIPVRSFEDDPLSARAAGDRRHRGSRPGSVAHAWRFLPATLAWSYAS